jgi:hypothetical protein
MKNKFDFVTNSSSTSYIITNLSGEKKTLVDFVKENPELIENFKDEYLNSKYYDEKYRAEYNQENLIKSAQENNITFQPNTSLECVFGDEDGTFIGRVFDYILRDGGRSQSFSWYLNEYLR